MSEQSWVGSDTFINFILLLGSNRAEELEENNHTILKEILSTNKPADHRQVKQGKLGDCAGNARYPDEHFTPGGSCLVI